MPRYKLTLEYDGGPFVGWQRQENGRSVQQAVEEAIQAITGAAVDSIVAGRTDAGVHARGQVLHFDLDRDFRTDRLLQRLLHRAAVLLPLPADEGAAVIFERELVARHQPMSAKAGANTRSPAAGAGAKASAIMPSPCHAEPKPAARARS